MVSPLHRLLRAGCILLAPMLTVLGADAHFQAAGTKKMIERLAAWNKTSAPKSEYSNTAELEALNAKAALPLPPAERIFLQASRARLLLELGQINEALGIFTNLQLMARANRVTVTPRQRDEMKTFEGLAHLRWGEVQNCLMHHNSDSCLFPLRAKAVHMHKEGAEQAFPLFLELAEKNTNDFGSRWLANVAAMTLGKYPDGVPSGVVIPPSTFDSDYPLPRFPDVASKAGLAVNDLAGGSITEDFDGDGLLDVLLSCWDMTGQLRLFKNLGNGKFLERSSEAGLEGGIL